MQRESYKYERYLDSNQETRWATSEEIKKAGLRINLHAPIYPGAGLPLISNGHEAYVDNEDTHTIIFGATGSKKTRLFCMPMLNMFIKAGESFIATDPKGELYKATSGIANAHGYKTVVLNFRDIGYGDTWNPLDYPYELYHSGKKDAAVTMINDLAYSLAAPQMECTDDIFWPTMAATYASALLMIMIECATKEEFNMGSLGNLCALDNEDALKKIAGRMSSDSFVTRNLNGVLTGAKETRQSVYTVLYGMVSIFNMQKNLTRMLSKTSFDITKFGHEKTAVYLIVPDEKSTYHFLITTFIKQAYEILISEAQKAEKNKLPIRVNFVLDEFCNIPKVKDMPAMISAARSRNMRYYLVAQSLHQLKGKYGEDADTIKGNCDNWVFLTSKELDLLNEISNLCGTVYTASGKQRRLISASELQRLKKEREKSEALIIHAREYPFITDIADIDKYTSFKGYEPVVLNLEKLPKCSIFSIKELLRKILLEDATVPFANGDYDEEE